MNLFSSKTLLILITLLLVTPTVFADNFKWESMKDFPPGAEIAVVSGDLAQKGTFTVRLKLPPHYIVPAHSHPFVARATVISGTYYIGTGVVADANLGKPLTMGDSFTIPANNKHYGFTKQGAVLQLEATGPWNIMYSANG
jgi:quercetin dioxygenase-like cupin family protein